MTTALIVAACGVLLAALAVWRLRVATRRLNQILREADTTPPDEG